MGSRLLLDRDFLRTLQQVSLVCRQNLSGTIGTDHPSSNRGSGQEFADYRRYSFGDDPRFLDWNAYLRLGKLFLKIYQTEEHIPVRVLLDTSGSMDPESDGEKFVYAKRLAATFAYLALLHLDTAVIVPFAEGIGRNLVASGGRDKLWPVLRFIGDLTTGGRTDLLNTVKQFSSMFHTRGVAVIVSDFFETGEERCAKAVELLRRAGHDFVLMQVHTPGEQRPAPAGELILQDAESGEEKRVHLSPAAAAAYERAFLEFTRQLERVAVRNGGRYARAVTSIPYQEFVLQQLRGTQVLE